MNGQSASPELVLVLTTEPERSDLYVAWLSVQYDAQVVSDVDALADALTDDVMVAFVDGGLVPSGTASLDDRDGRPFTVFLVNGTISPSMLSWPIDDYLRKPVSSEDLLDAVDRMRRREALTPVQREFVRKTTLKRKLDRDFSPAILDENDGYSALLSSIKTVEERMKEPLPESFEIEEAG